MTISELGSLGEFIGSIVVVITLIYLAIQVRQNTLQSNQSMRVAQTQISNEITQKYQLFMWELAKSRHLRDVWNKTLSAQSADDLDEDEQAVAYNLLYHLFLTSQDAFLSRELEVYPEGQEDTDFKWLTNQVLSAPYPLRWWNEQLALGSFGGSYRAAVDKAISDNAAAKSP